MIPWYVVRGRFDNYLLTHSLQAKYTLIPYTDSWWNGANIPGKQKQSMM